MALTYSKPLDPDFTCPDFELPVTRGGMVGSQFFKNSGRPFLIAFICNHCPYVQAIEKRLIALSYLLERLQIGFLAISSNDARQYPEDSFEQMKAKNYPFLYAYDETQIVAKKFEAVCTPDFYLFNKKGKLRYRGRLDDSWKDANLVTRQELLEAAILLIAQDDLPPDFKVHPSMGCSLKWKDG
ncbi:MAG: thioredoxin family protein [Bdellovibrionaceae bacterium]|nr:thioredoxin family protein [Pseudobdellovibrionaceae bacterium]MDW8190346.1 thioredoxin family protein [Pseudobdellovibrionaceae bacterium]